jgi:hypothetical protein
LRTQSRLALQTAALKLNRITDGHYDGVRSGPDLAEGFGASNSTEHKEVKFDELFVGWNREKRPGEKTGYSWKRVLDQLGLFVGHRDANRLTAEDIVRWKNALIETGTKGKTIRDSKIAPIRAILQWGVDNRLLKANVAHRVTVNAKPKIAERIRGYTDEEASLVLSAALREKDALRRWVPWLCAYSGARISEICQLGRIYQTLSGHMVRSKSEVIIANILFERKISFEYEAELQVDGEQFSPDFTIKWNGKTYYWEHLGLLEQAQYKSEWQIKEAMYKKRFPGGLITTTESAVLSKTAEGLVSRHFG